MNVICGRVHEVGVVVERRRVVEDAVVDAVGPVDVVVADGHLAGAAGDLVRVGVGPGKDDSKTGTSGRRRCARTLLDDVAVDELVRDGFGRGEQVAGSADTSSRSASTIMKRGASRRSGSAPSAADEHVPLGAGAVDDRAAARVVEVEGEEVPALGGVGLEELGGSEREPGAAARSPRRPRWRPGRGTPSG